MTEFKTKPGDIFVYDSDDPSTRVICLVLSATDSVDSRAVRCFISYSWQNEVEIVSFDRQGFHDIWVCPKHAANIFPVSQ